MKINEIEKDIKIPQRNSEIYPLEKMEIGDSFLITPTDEDLRKIQRRVQPAIWYYGRYHHLKFKTRLMKNENGVRIWRVK